jgi:hypothetical protein
VDAEIGRYSHYPDVRGFALLPKVEFWQLFLTMGLLSGIGLMTIKFVSLFSYSPLVYQSYYGGQTNRPGVTSVTT